MRARWKQWLVPFGLTPLVGVACSERVVVYDHLPPADTTSHYIRKLEPPPMPLDPAPATLPAPPAPPDCAAIERCLESRVPRRFHPDAVSEEWSECFGTTKREQWRARTCGPFDVGRDVRNGLRVEAHVSCGDLCPQYTRLRLSYADVLPGECACLDASVDNGAMFIFGRPSYHAWACSPFPVVYKDGKRPRSYPALLGVSLDDRNKVLSVNGKPVDAAEAEAVIASAHQKLPNTILLDQGERRRHIRYVRQRDMERFWNIIGLQFFREGERRPVCTEAASGDLHNPITVFMDGTPFEFFRTCSDERSQRLQRVRELIKAYFDEPPASSAQPSPHSIPCKTLRSRPIILSTPRGHFDSDVLEVRFLDWIRPIEAARNGAPAARR